MNRSSSLGCLVVAGLVVAVATQVRATPALQEANSAERAFGKWHSTEQFEGEPRISLSLRRTERSIAGWALLLGQHRKLDDRATLGLSFTDAVWSGQAVLFSTILPEDEGTIGWELRVTSPTSAVLTALTENGAPIQDELKWDMTR
jgi:hypothetical protein